MPIFGPRIDRASPIGGGGRPSTTSLGVAGTTLVVAVVALGFVMGLLQQLASLGTLVAITITGVALLQRDRVGPQVVGHLCLLPTTAVLLWLLTAGSGYPHLAVVRWGVVIAAVGLSATATNVGDYKAFQTATAKGLLSYAFTFVGVVVTSVVVSVTFLCWQLAQAFLSGLPPGTALAGTAVAVLVAAGGSAIVLWVVPLSKLSPRHRRKAHTAQLRRRCWQLGKVAVGALAGAVLLGAAREPLSAAFIGTVPGTALSVLGAVVSVPLLAVGMLALAVSIVVVVLQRVTEPSSEGEQKHLAAAVAAIVFQGCLFVLVVGVLPLGPSALFVVLGFAVAGPLVATMAIGLTSALLRSRFVPGRTVGPATAATGLLVAAIGSGLATVPAVVTFGCVAAAMVVWDATAYGFGITTELGELPPTRRLELVHGVFSVGLGAVAVGLLAGLDLLRAATASAVGGQTAVTVATLGIVALLLALRG